MKLPTKPISSPGRAEKYPPPLMRFLRSNVGSRSRGRSRSSPMFVRKKNAVIETQEPSSPKVTCIGQVRVKRSKQAKNTRHGKSKRRCKWIQKVLFCQHLKWKLKPKCSKPSWRKWVMFFHLGFKRKSKIREDCSKIQPKFSNISEDLEQESEEEEDDDDNQVAAKVYVSAVVSPPKNALILTRSRSAPYRSSSLACRFWGSPLDGEETDQKHSTDQENTEEEEDEKESPTWKKESICREIDQESRLDPDAKEKQSFFQEFDGPVSSSIKERILNPVKVEDLKTEESVTELPMILTRCKSEPARTTSEKIDPELSFWKKRRLGFT